MEKQCRKRRLEKWIFTVLILGSILVNIKSIFTSCGLDVQYALAMSYRMAQGDKMFLQMWEPHQTSAFFAAALIKSYLTIFHTTTGIVVFMNLAGVLLKGAVTAVLYRTLRKYVDRRALLCMCIFFFTVNPKWILMPEFSNMQLWFSVLLFCCLFRYFRDQKKKKWLLLSGFFLCLEVLAYPSCMIVYFGVLLCLLLYARNKRADILLLTGECTVCGSIYVLYFTLRMGIGEFVNRIREIIMGDASHTGIISAKLSRYGKDVVEIMLFLGIYAVLSCAVVKIFSFFRKRQPGKEWYIICFLLCFYVQNFISTLTAEAEPRYAIVYLPICILGWILCKYCSEEETQACRMGIIVSGCGVIATLLLSNLTVYTTLLYGTLGVGASLLSCGSVIKRRSGGVEREPGPVCCLCFAES
ncbi:MAG: hypothetical protein NC517_01465 [Firmicutes bacterium]|nr:hypothetical protein [Bacillota bacterium]